MLAAATVGLLAAVALTAGAALASSGVKGSPQPEVRSFKIGASITGGSVAIEPDGGLVVAYGIGAGEGETAVCVLARAGHACTHKTTLSPLSGDDLFGSTYAFISSASHVSVLQTDCCDSSTQGGDLLFTSANGGKSFGSPDTTRVAYAPAGSDFDASSSYHIVGTFSGQSLTGISGGALVTQKASGGEELELRMFNGGGFGAEHAVPHTKGGGPEWFGVDQDPSGRAHVFSESTHLSRDYDLYEQSSSTGARWSGPLNLGNAIDASSFAVALDARGSGLVLGTSPAVGFPVLGSQSVSFALKHSSVRAGRSVTASGTVGPHGAGRPGRAPGGAVGPLVRRRLDARELGWQVHVHHQGQDGREARLPGRRL
jgi:hypothetical protein